LAQSSSAAKRNTQNTRRRLRNRMYKSRVKSLRKQLETDIQGKKTDSARDRFRELESLLDSGVNKGILHRNAVARTKSRLHHRLNGIQ